MVEGLIDLFEMTITGLPFYHITSQLCEQARSSVLPTSIEKISVTGIFDELLRLMWLTDMDSKNGLRKYDQMLARVPPLVCLRTSLASHFLMRIHWSHGKYDDRTRLLEAAHLSLKPLTTARIDKGRMERELKRLREDETEEAAAHGYTE